MAGLRERLQDHHAYILKIQEYIVFTTLQYGFYPMVINSSSYIPSVSCFFFFFFPLVSLGQITSSSKMVSEKYEGELNEMNGM